MNAPLTIPDLEEHTLRDLQILASDHGQTLEAEAREVLAQAIALAAARKASDDKVNMNAAKQAFLALAGCVDGAPDLSTKRGFER